MLRQWNCYRTSLVKQKASRNDFSSASTVVCLIFECPSKASYKSQIKPHIVYIEEERQKCCTKKWEAATVEEHWRGGWWVNTSCIECMRIGTSPQDGPLSFRGKKTSARANFSEQNLQSQSEPLFSYSGASSRDVAERICVPFLKWQD